MNKQDYSAVRNWQEVERRLQAVQKNYETNTNRIYQTDVTLKNTIKSLVLNLKDVWEDQGEVSLWFFSGTPTTESVIDEDDTTKWSQEPYISWTTPEDHIGDIYYDIDTGNVYQYTAEGWNRNSDVNLVQAMALTYSDLPEGVTERRVHIDIPTNYESGDWWIKQDGSLWICKNGTLAGNPNEDFGAVQSYSALLQDYKKMKESQEANTLNIATLRVDTDEISSTVSSTTTEISSIKTRTSKLEQDANGWDFKFRDLEDYVDEVDGKETEHHREFTKHIRFENGVIILGEENSEFQARISDDRISFYQGSTEVAYLSNNKLYITNAEILTSLRLGNFGFTPRNNGSLSFGKVVN